MNKKQQKILDRVFQIPTRSDIEWKDIQSLLTACDADISRGRGSRIRIVLSNQILNIHKPHPQKELKKYTVELVRDFLVNVGVKPQ